jgi:hypothetical protein
MTSDTLLRIDLGPQQRSRPSHGFAYWKAIRMPWPLVSTAEVLLTVHEASELAVDIRAHERLEVTDCAVGDEDDGQIVALALGLSHDEVDRRVVAREVEPLPRDSFGSQQLLDPNKFSNIPVFLEIDEHWSRLGVASWRDESDLTQLREAGARASASFEFFAWRKRPPQRHVQTSREILWKANREQRVPTRGGDGAIEYVPHDLEHVGSSPETAGPVKGQSRALGAAPSFAQACNIAAKMSEAQIAWPLAWAAASLSVIFHTPKRRRIG